MAMFAIIFFRLWFLQVLSGEQYVPAGRRQPACATCRSPRRAGRSSTGPGSRLSQAVRPNAVQIVPSALAAGRGGPG